jgi:hypothetical protein
MSTARKKVSVWAVRHPVHGTSVRTTECSPNNQPPGWSQEEVELRRKAADRLRELLAESSGKA